MREQRLKRLKTNNDSTLHTPQAEQLPLWQALFENAMDAVLLVDDDACCLDGNPAASQLLGRPRAEIPSLAMWDIHICQSQSLRRGRPPGHSGIDGVSDFSLPLSGDGQSSHRSKWL